MKFLEHKIPPPLVAITCAVIMWLIAGGVPHWSLLTWSKGLALVVLYLIGTAFSLGGVFAFKKAKTTLNPLQPCESSALVQSGVYKITRNPMYLGMAVFLLMWAIYLGSWASLLGLALYVAYMNQFQIKPEERAMRSLFGDTFEQYCQQTRRWL